MFVGSYANVELHPVQLIWMVSWLRGKITIQRDQNNVSLITGWMKLDARNWYPVIQWNTVMKLIISKCFLSQYNFSESWLNHVIKHKTIFHHYCNTVQYYVYCMQHNNGKGGIWIISWTHNRQPILCPHGWAVGVCCDQYWAINSLAPGRF